MRSVTGYSLFFLLIVSGCDKGLGPLDRSNKAELYGNIHIVSTQPSADSNTILAVALIKSPAPYSDSALIQGIGNGNVLPLILNYPLSDTTYSYALDPGVYGYLGIAYRFGPDIFKDWEVVSSAASGEPVEGIILRSGERKRIDLLVNFDSLPVQPFIR